MRSPPLTSQTKAIADNHENALASDRHHQRPSYPVSRWEHEHILEAVQRRLDEHPEKMRQRRETVEHPFGTVKARMGATHFLMKTLRKVATDMALHVLAYNLTRVMNIIGVRQLMAAMRAQSNPKNDRALPPRPGRYAVYLRAF